MEPKPQKPSIGRIVHYKSYGTPNGEYVPECRAAIVTAVVTHDTDNNNPLGDYVVSLCVLNPSGMFFNETVFIDEKEKRGGTWHWPERV